MPPTQSMDGNLDQQYIIIDVTHTIKLILEGNNTRYNSFIPGIYENDQL